MRRRYRMCGSTAAATEHDGHAYSGGSGLHPPATGPTGPTSHRLGVSRGVDWWVRPSRPRLGAAASGRTCGRHRRAAQPPEHRQGARVRAWLTEPGDRVTAPHHRVDETPTAQATGPGRSADETSR